MNAPETPRSTLEIAAETCVVLLVCVIPNVFNSVSWLYLKHERGPFLYQSAVTVIRSVGTIALVAFLIHRSKEPRERFGLKRLSVLYDGLGGIGVFLLGILGYYLVWYALAMLLGRERLHSLMNHDLSALAAPTRDLPGFSFLIVSAVSNGFAEELVIRAYLLPRFEQFFRSTILAVLLSAAFFASYHTYQGTAGVVSAFEIGVVYGIVFCLWRRFLPLAVGHAIQDVIGLLMLK
jgi:membrane protease YdiL (CAAX protease family)